MRLFQAVLEIEIENWEVPYFFSIGGHSLALLSLYIYPRGRKNTLSNVSCSLVERIRGDGSHIPSIHLLADLAWNSYIIMEEDNEILHMQTRHLNDHLIII